MDSNGNGHGNGGGGATTAMLSLPIGLPAPTREYRTHRKIVKATEQPGLPIPRPTIPIPLPPLRFRGSRVVIYKQDPTVTSLGYRMSYLPNRALPGPRDARITNGSPGLAPVSSNVFGDFLQTPGTDAFDAVQGYAVVRMTLTMYERARSLIAGSPQPIPWQWNGAANQDPLAVFPRGLPDVMNAFYSRTQRALKFGDFIRQGSSPPERVYTCRSLDIVAHEAGHAILDGLKPNWILFGSSPQTGGLHESFGDLSAIFLALSQLDQAESVIAITKANLHDKIFLSDMAEQFGLALGRPNGLRNADNDLRLSQVGTEVHAISQVFTGAIYDILADIFTFERKPGLKDDAATLHEVGQYVLSLVLRALIAAPSSNASFADVANHMLAIANADGRPIEYQNFIRNRFVVREVLAAPFSALAADHKDGATLEAAITDAEDAVQDRSACCGTMNLDEFFDTEGQLEAEIADYRKQLERVGAAR
jgi:hypothetical protein